MKIIINCAMSVDGKIAMRSRKETKISNREDLVRLHNLRNEVDAILVGIGTVLADDPKLTVGEKYAEVKAHPLRIVLDSEGRTPLSARILNGESKTLIVTNEKCSKIFPGAEVVRLGKELVDLGKLVNYLEKKGVKRLLVEGGELVMWSFIKERLVDEVVVFVGSMVIGGKDAPTMAGGEGSDSMEEIIRLKFVGCEKLGDGVLLRYGVIK